MTRRFFLSLGAATPCPPPTPKFLGLSSGRSWGKRILWGIFSTPEALERTRKDIQLRWNQVHPAEGLEWNPVFEVEVDRPRWENL